jgi:hypothetical protein
VSIYLNSYYPVGHTSFGNNAIKQFGLHPLIDGSIRREPDFSHPLSPISGLCRPGKMADFHSGDIIVYKTNASHILTAVLELDGKFNTHQEAAEWLTLNGYAIPSNNILTSPLPLSQSHAHGYMNRIGTGKKLDDAIHSQWNNLYLERGSNPKNSYFYTTKSLYNAVADNVQPEHYVHIGDVLRQQMGSIPRTNWRPEPIPDEVLNEIMKLIPEL